MKIKSTNIISFLMFAISIIGGYSAVSAQSVQIVPNSNNQYFFANSAYGRNYYANNLGYNYNYNSPCYGLKACYSLNYLNYSNNYPTYYYTNYASTNTYTGYNYNSYNYSNYNNNYNPCNCNNGYTNYNYNYDYNNYYNNAYNNDYFSGAYSNYPSYQTNYQYQY